MKNLLIFLFLLFISFSSFSSNYWENDILRFEKEDSQNPRRSEVSLFVGSSSIRLWKSLDKDFKELNVLNRGFGGSQISDLLFYYKRIIVNYDLKRLVIYSGENDIDYGKTPKKVLSDMQELIWKIHEQKNIPILILSIKPSPRRSHLSSRFKEANDLLKNAFKENKKVIFVDAYKKFFNTDGTIRPELFASDDLHMNNEGYRIWIEALREVLNL
jgi:lysophospholipase L1-like esterase